MLVECGTNSKWWLTFIGEARKKIFRTVKIYLGIFLPQLYFVAFSKEVKQDVVFVLSYVFSYREV